MVMGEAPLAKEPVAGQDDHRLASPLDDLLGLRAAAFGTVKPSAALASDALPSAAPRMLGWPAGWDCNTLAFVIINQPLNHPFMRIYALSSINRLGLERINSSRTFCCFLYHCVKPDEVFVFWEAGP